MPAKKSAIILGSAPDAMLLQDFSAEWMSAKCSHAVALNNAWRLRSDWGVAIYPKNFPSDRRPKG
jgi:hypothetical protein